MVIKPITFFLSKLLFIHYNMTRMGIGFNFSDKTLKFYRFGQYIRIVLIVIKINQKNSGLENLVF